MDKQVQFFGHTDLGIFCQALFGSAGAFEKTAGAPPFADWETGDQLRKFISKLTKEDRKKHSYVLVNALGAGEFFGSNINADFFPWNALTHEGNDYGYKTFETFAHAYQHHKNKDPTRAFGVPVLSLLNPRMKRVELVIRLDRAKAKEEQADGIITRIDAGEFPDVSMGCKVPYDICSICNQKSKTRFDYCQHMQPPAELRSVYGPNKILPDGRKIYVINTMPKFFDISFVFIGADKTAKVMAKVASRGNQVCLGDVCAIPRLSTSVYEITAPGIAKTEELSKVASVSDAGCSCGCGTCGDAEKLAQDYGFSGNVKVGEILKRVPAGSFVQKVLPGLEASEPSIPKETLNDLAKSHSVADIASGAGSMGIVLKPQEFQRIILVRMGNDELADKLDSQHSTFRNVDSVDNSIDIDPVSTRGLLRELLSSLIESRCGLGEPLKKRVIQISIRKMPLPTQTTLEHPLLDKISAAYNGYRRSLVTKLSQVEAVIQGDPMLRDEIMGTRLLDVFSKTANSSLLSPDSMAYMMGAHLTNRELLFNSDIASVVSESNWLQEEPTA